MSKEGAKCPIVCVGVETFYRGTYQFIMFLLKSNFEYITASN